MRLVLYLDHRTWIHRLHPVVRFSGMIAFFITAFVVERPQWLLPLAALLLVLLWGTGSLTNVYRLRYLFVLVFIMTFIVWTLSYGADGSDPLFVWGPLTISRTAPIFALGMAIRLNTFLAAGILFLSTTRVEEFAYALARIGVPYKLGFTMTLAFRLVPAFLDAAYSVVQAQRCRGLDFEHGSLWRRLRRYVAVIVPVFMGGLRRADNMAMALEARGFQSTHPRTMLRPVHFGPTDAATLVALAVLTVTYLVLWSYGVLSLPRNQA